MTTNPSTRTDADDSPTDHAPAERRLDIPVDLSTLTDAQASILHEAACDPDASFTAIANRANVSPSYASTTIGKFWPAWRKLDGSDADPVNALFAGDGGDADPTGLDAMFGEGTADAFDELAEAIDEMAARLDVIEDRAQHGGEFDTRLDDMATRMNAFSRAADAIRGDVAALEDTLGTVNDDAQAALDDADRNDQRLDRVERDVVAANDAVADVDDRLDALAVTVGAMHQRLAHVEAALDDGGGWVGADDHDGDGPSTDHADRPAADVDRRTGRRPDADATADESDDTSTWGIRLPAGWGGRL